MAGVLYYLFFQCTGFCLVFAFCQKKLPAADFFTRLLFGSCTGSLLFTWLPILFSFLFDFTLTAHIAAAITAVCLILLFFRRFRPKMEYKKRNFTAPHILFFLCFAAFMGFFGYLLHTHTLLTGENDGLFTGQSTYGDMNMHLGFITSIAKQQIFPPE